jgi:Ran GTPase-activating protein (RanGAP) involved in mRNA processing and transport
MSDNEDSDEDDEYGCNCDECVNRRFGQNYGYDDEDEDDAYFTPASSVPALCAQLRANDPSVLPEGPNQIFEADVKDSFRPQIAEALLQNTIIRLVSFDVPSYSKLSAEAMAKYLAQSKRLLYVELIFDDASYMLGVLPPPNLQVLSTFIEAVGQSSYINELNLVCPGLGAASKSFENLLTRTKTLRYLRFEWKGRAPVKKAAMGAIVSAFSKNTSLRTIVLVEWQEAILAPVLTALRDHPVLESLQVEGLSSFTGIDALLRGKNSQLKQFTIARFKGSIAGEQMVGFESFMLEMGRNTTILKMSISDVPLSHDNAQQLKGMLRRNTVLQDLYLGGNALGSTAFVEIASVLHRNTSIQGLDVTNNGLDDLVAAKAIRELLRRNKTITRFCMEENAFGSNVAAVKCIADGVRANTTLQELNLPSCELDDQGLSILAVSLGQQKRSLENLNLAANQITCSGLRALVNNATVALSAVTHLNLSSNYLLDEGASFLAEALQLQTLPSLTHLCLFECDISDDGLMALLSALEENDTLYELDLGENVFSVQGCMALASSLPNIKGLRSIGFPWTTPDPSVMSALLEGFRKNTSLHFVNIVGGEQGKDWLPQVSFFLDRNKFSCLLRDSDTDDRASLGLWSRALGSVATRPDVLFHVLTSKAGLIRATPGEDSNKRKRDDSE